MHPSFTKRVRGWQISSVVLSLCFIGVVKGLRQNLFFLDLRAPQEFRRNPLEQGSPDCGWRAQSSPPPAFINKVLLQHGRTHPRLVSHSSRVVVTGTVGPARPGIPSDPLRNSLVTLQSKRRLALIQEASDTFPVQATGIWESLAQSCPPLVSPGFQGRQTPGAFGLTEHPLPGK